MKSTNVVDPRRSNYSRRFSTSVLTRVLAISILFLPNTDSIFRNDEGPPVRYFERVHYSEGYKDHHHIQKRSLGSPLTLQFHSLGRIFRLNLIPDETVFHPGVHIENSDGNHLETSGLPVVGHIEEDDKSSVHGILDSDGTFEGVIVTGNGEEFYVEPSKRYWKEHLTRGESLMYRSEDVLSSPETPCQSHLLHLHRKENGSEVDESEAHFKKPRRRKRWVIDQRKKTCMLFLQADYAFFSRFGSEEAAINVMTGHIQRLNQIYRETDFNMDGASDDIQFMIKRVKVHTKNRTMDPSYPYDGHFEVIKFLEVFSEGDYDSFCLAYLFTYRDFEGGTLGLAWTGDLKNAGGVCEKKGHFRGGIKSLNTGIITLLNYGKLVSPAVSHVTLAHEIGHNFGSPHDPDNDKSCTPGGDDGNFIMFARATAGDRRNNNKFSLCSLKSINPVLSVKARDTYGCFQEPQKAICGNGVVEEGEECDCGWEEDCKETCCFPMRRPSWTGSASAGTPCRLKPHSECSPSKGPCCTDKCTFTLGQKCRDDNGCRNTAYCDGQRAECPPSVLKPNKTICDKNSHVCFMGECTGSICLAYGLESCQCSQETFDRTTKLCEVCCRVPGDSQCISSFDWNEVPYDMPSVLAKPGTPCRNYTGYCDSYHSCREVDPSGPLATLRKLLSADEGLATIAEWVDNHWYVVIGIILILIVLMGLTLRVSRKQRLRKQTVLHSNVEAIQIQRSYLEDSPNGQGTVHPTAVRKKIPFKKKVRERRSKHKQQKTKERKTGTSEIQNGRSSLWKGRKPPSSKTPENSLPKSPSASSGGDNLPGPSGTQPTTSLTNHNHEVKRAIVPNAKRKSARLTKKGEPLKSPAKSFKKKVQHSPPAPDGERFRKKSPPKSAPSRRNIQVVYRPPFSVKVEFVPEETESSKASKHPGTSANRKNPVASKAQPDPSTAQGNSKSKSRNSLLRRRTSKTLVGGNNAKNPKSELQILIPKTQEEEDSTTPQLLTS